MSEKWTIEQLFWDDNKGNPFKREPELMYLWECRDGKEAVRVWKGYSTDMLEEVARTFKRNAAPGVTYCVEFPSRKGKRDGEFTPARKFDGGAKCLPNQAQRMLITMIEGRWGATLNEHIYMQSHGRTLAFYMKSDAKKETVFSFETWDEVRQMAYTRP